MATANHNPVQSSRENILLMLLKEQCDAMRARSEPEHLYTAAAVGGFGAVAWGVATLDPSRYLNRPFILRPALVAALGILAVACLICRKIIREHEEFEKAKKVRISVATSLAESEDGREVVPDYMKSGTEGLGYKGSIWIVVGSAVVASIFCLSLAFC